MSIPTPEPASRPRSMTAAEIAAAVAELAPDVVGGVVTRVRGPWPHHLALEVRKAGRNVEFVVGVAPLLARVHRAADLPPSPPRAGVFTLRARKLLRPARVVALEAVPGERVVILTVSHHDAEAGPWETRLVAELFGRGRLFLLDAAHRVLAWEGPGGSRGLQPGAAYVPPPVRPPGAEAPAPEEPPPPWPELEARYAAWLSERASGERQRTARAARARERASLERRVRRMAQDLSTLAEHPAWRREGELLAAHRHLLARGMTAVTVTDWFAEGSPQRAIPLDPALAPEANVEARFKRARRAERGIAVLTERLAAARERLARLEAEADAPVPEAEETPEAGRPRRKAAPLPGLKRFALAGGWEAVVGRGAEENERVTFRVARGNDLWFHARDAAGAHVVLRGPGQPPPDAVRAAALLAAHFSRLKRHGGGEVLYTPRKYVRRIKGAKGRERRPGRVEVTQERVLQVALEEREMARLLARRVGAGEGRDPGRAPGP